MTLSDLRKKPHLSASSIGQYIDCSLAYRFSKIDMIRQEFQADALIYGSCIHRVLEFYYLERKKDNKPSLLELTILFDQVWREAAEDNQNIQYRKGNDFESLLVSGKSLLTAYYSSLPSDNYKILGVETAFELFIEGLPIPIIGAVDLVEEDEAGVVIVTDHKTSAKSYSVSEVDNNFQLTVYDLAFKKAYPDREIILKFDCLIKTQKPKFEQYYTVRSEADEKKAIKKILSVWDGIQKGVFIPNDTSWKCGGCSFKQNCEDWLLN